MSTEIFATNFRGFSRVCIDIERNIFLIGDNSSGKSSILYLVNCVTDRDLLGIPALGENQFIDRNDFFSPYFEYKDVTIGFRVENEQQSMIRAVTIKKDRVHSSLNVCKFTVASRNTILSFRVSGGKVYGSVKKVKCLPSVDEVISAHQKSRGSTELDIELDRPISEESFLIRAVYRLGLSEDSEVQRLIFATPLPAPRHIGPMRAQPESFYQFDRVLKASGSHFASIMQDLSDSKSETSKIVRNFGKESGLFDDLKVRKISNKIENSPLSVEVERNGRTFSLKQVGVGVSQVAPIIAETLASTGGLLSASLFLIHQPELHLHPVAQAALGEYLFDMSCRGMTFIIETHSDYLIDRFRSRIRSDNAKDKASILYCHNEASGNYIDKIDISAHGKLVDPPEGYGEFFLKEIARTMF